MRPSRGRAASGIGSRPARDAASPLTGGGGPASGASTGGVGGVSLFDDALRERARAHLAGFERRAVALDGRRHAGVAVVLLPDDEGRACLLLTKRTRGRRKHSGQWGLPRGRGGPP